ncbi:sulfite exporter TauE/SafE family protein [Ferruginibacter sp. SUN002]|uniref:sulfite exporter TauE/SafE family protein n=1 Tax=Ferruginibacter sp. SUN002 TaxID=2937789 RepID=UPI003D362A9D
MLTIFIAAFSMGIIGSFHCVGMCGPLALSLPISNNSFQSKFSSALLYNSGRIVTYSSFGFVFGLIGKSLILFGLQQWISILLGAAIIILLVLPKLFPGIYKNIHFSNNFFEKLRSAIGSLFFKKNQSSLFAIGLLNGLLPCGLVYIAIAAAVATGNIGSSVLFMTAFGLGTLPVMWSIAFFGNYIGVNIRQKIRKAYPYLMILMACLLIIRGMGLGIPYVSPSVDIQKKAVHNCCHKN